MRQHGAKLTVYDLSIKMAVHVWQCVILFKLLKVHRFEYKGMFMCDRLCLSKPVCLSKQLVVEGGYSP